MVRGLSRWKRYDRDYGRTRSETGRSLMGYPRTDSVRDRRELRLARADLLAVPMRIVH